MLECGAVREQIAIDPLSVDDALETHMTSCTVCMRYRQRLQALEPVVKAELQWQAPQDLTARLLALTTMPVPLLITAPMRPQPWYVNVIGALSVAVVMVSVAVIWQIAAGIALQFGLGELLTELAAWPGRGLTILSIEMPQSRYVIDLFMRIREQLLWVLLVIVLWLTVEQLNPRLVAERRQIHS
ncbi:MAG TPA: hypothetical protein PKA05_03335 [Roseiflexaceae bacterium]|nr:hypothetical protein [Roseiflexaceae bacterium]HMP39392.1 hypothetical protein [Roseiflexaceae bacterium]